MGALGTQAPASLGSVHWAWVPGAVQGRQHAEVDSGQHTWPDASSARAAEASSGAAH
eukprot:CAMPEP_0116960806 /NCGR_PEP_ID=MMETSP0467-20121206/46175_1 /TAXON_ID=283647 /ORGANISM="Mesodinium pulex, Strain SPMC105" /LENGTH=56 /DNA_ID=CAMNT_0004648595 /DNA_START=34 /DNA_END=204 /DNA_ORIENTATION=-